MTLSDFSVRAPEGGLLGADSVNVHTYNSDGDESGNYSYLDQAAIDGNGYTCEPGWYTYDSIGGWTFESANDVILPFGTGVMVISDCGADICCAGEVPKTSIDLVLNDQLTTAGFSYLGNCSPVSNKLKDIGVVAPEGGLTGADSVNIHTYNSDGDESGNYSYLDQAAIDGNGYTCEPGWYTYDSIGGWTFENVGELQLAAGQMFMVISDCGATISIPSPLTENK